MSSSQMDDSNAYIQRQPEDGWEHAYPYSSQHQPLAYAAFGVNPSMLSEYQGVPSQIVGSYVSPYTPSHAANLPYTADDMKPQPPYFLDHRSASGYPVYVSGSGRGTAYMPQQLYYEHMYAATRRKEHLAAAARAAEEEAFYKAAFSEMVCLPDDDEDEVTEATAALSEGASSTTVENSPKSEVDHDEDARGLRAASSAVGDDAEAGSSRGQSVGERMTRDSHARSGAPLATAARLAAAHLVDNCSIVSTAGDSSVRSTPFSSRTDHDPNDALSDAASPTGTVMSEHDRTVREALRDPDHPSLTEPIASLVSEQASDDGYWTSVSKADDMALPDRRPAFSEAEMTHDPMFLNPRPLTPSRSPSHDRLRARSLSASSPPPQATGLLLVSDGGKDTETPAASDIERADAYDEERSESEDETLIQYEGVDPGIRPKHLPDHRSDHEPPGDTGEDLEDHSRPSLLRVKEEPSSPIIVDPTRLPPVIDFCDSIPPAPVGSSFADHPVVPAVDGDAAFGSARQASSISVPTTVDPSNIGENVSGPLGTTDEAAGRSSAVNVLESDARFEWNDHPQQGRSWTDLSPLPEERSATLPPSPTHAAIGATLPSVTADEGTDDGEDMSISSEEPADVPEIIPAKTSSMKGTSEEAAGNVSRRAPIQAPLPEDSFVDPSLAEDRSLTPPSFPTRVAVASLDDVEDTIRTVADSSAARQGDRSLTPQPSPTRALQARSFDDGLRQSPSLPSPSVRPVSHASPSSSLVAPHVDSHPVISIDTRLSPVEGLRLSPSSSDTSRLSTLAEVAVYHLSPPLQHSPRRSRDPSVPNEVDEPATATVENRRSATPSPSLERAAEAIESEESRVSDSAPLGSDGSPDAGMGAPRHVDSARPVNPSPAIERARAASALSPMTSVSSLTELSDSQEPVPVQSALVSESAQADAAPVSADGLDESASAMGTADAEESTTFLQAVQPTSRDSSPLTSLTSSQAESSRSFQALFNSSPSPALDESNDGGYFSDDDTSGFGSSPFKITPSKITPSKIGLVKLTPSKGSQSRASSSKSSVTPANVQPLAVQEVVASVGVLIEPELTEPDVEEASLAVEEAAPVDVPVVVEPEGAAEQLTEQNNTVIEALLESEPSVARPASGTRMVVDFVLVPSLPRRRSTQNLPPAAAAQDDTSEDIAHTTVEPDTKSVAQPAPRPSRHHPPSFELIPDAPLMRPFGPGRTRSKKAASPPPSPNPFLASSPSPRRSTSPTKKRKRASPPSSTPRTRAMKRMRVASPVVDHTDSAADADEDFSPQRDITPPPVHPAFAQGKSSFLKQLYRPSPPSSSQKPSSLKRTYASPPSSSQRPSKRLRVAFAEEESTVIPPKQPDFETRNELLPLSSVTNKVKVKNEDSQVAVLVPEGPGSDVAEPIEIVDESSEDELGGWEPDEVRVVSSEPGRKVVRRMFDLREPVRAQSEEGDESDEEEEEEKEEGQLLGRGSRVTQTPPTPTPTSRLTRSSTSARRHSEPIKRK